MNSAPVRSASLPSFCMICEISNSVVGQMSGQWVKPKNTRNGRPFMSCVADRFAVLVLEMKRPADRGRPREPIGDG